MATTDERSTTMTPKGLIVATIALSILRVVFEVVPVHAVTSPGSTIAWRSIDQLKRLAPPDKGKLVVYQFYANWSDPCKRMEETSLRNQQVCELVESKFTPVRITDLAHEKGQNPQYISDLEKRYRIFALPTLVVVGESGEPIGSLVGNCSSLTTYRFLSRALHNRNG